MKIGYYLIFIITFSTALSAYGNNCAEELAGLMFLHKQNPTLHRSQPVERAAKSIQKPVEKIGTWLRSLEQVSKHASHDPQVIERLKRSYYKLYVTSFEEITQGFYDLQIRIAREQGRGRIVLDANAKKIIAQAAINDQKKSLDQWIEYLVSADSSGYPMWAKLWCFNGLVKLGKWDSETGTFGPRDKSLVAPFPDLNREALAVVMDAIVKKVHGKSLLDIRDLKFAKLLEGASFGKLYGRILQNLHSQTTLSNATIEGEWVVYEQGSDHMPLVQSLQGMNTGWCTAGEETAKFQLSEGDFHVFYSLDKNGEPRIPRVAIRMEDSAIAEVRGIGKDQNLDSAISASSIVRDKFKSFGSEGEAYQKRFRQMARLTEIEKKHQAGLALSIDELRFLHEVDQKIDGFGYGKDPRIEEIIKTRSVKKDLALVFNVSESQISLTQAEALQGHIKYHHGSLRFEGLPSAAGLSLPEYVSGSLNLSGLKSAMGLKLPRHVGGSLNLNDLLTAANLILPSHIGEKLYLTQLISARGLKLSGHIGGSLLLSSLTSAEGLELPSHIDGNLDLRSLTSAVGLKLPRHIGGNLELNSLALAEGLVLPTHIRGDLNLFSLKSAAGLVLPNYIDGSLNLGALTSPAGLKLPDYVGGDLGLPSLISAAGLRLPERIGGSIVLQGLTSAVGLELPDYIEGSLFLEGLTSAKGLKLPAHIGENLDLQNLTSAPGLKFPDYIGGSLDLSSLTTATGLKFSNYIGGDLELPSLTSNVDVTFPEEVGGEIVL